MVMTFPVNPGSACCPYWKTRRFEAGGFRVRSVWNDLTGTPYAEETEWIGVIAQRKEKRGLPNEQ
jgi:hypothetical protein